MTDRSALVRQAALLLVTFVATMALLVGAASILVAGRSGGPGSTTPPSAEALASAAAPGASGPASAVAPSAASPASAAPLPSGELPTITITGAGNIADCTTNGAAQTSDLLVGQAGSVFTLGDNAGEAGSAAGYQTCYAPSWGRVLDRTILPVAGDGEWQTPGAAGYLGYFGAKAAPRGVTWYSLDLGAWHVVVLDSDCQAVGGCDAASAQGKWLATDLATSAARCTLALWHRPRFSSSQGGGDPAVAPFWDLLHRDGAELVVNAHDRDYERFAPQDPAGRQERPGGLREIVVGTGGAELGQFGRSAANSELRVAGEWGVLRLTLEPTRYDWEFLPVAGSDVADSGSTPCH